MGARGFTTRILRCGGREHVESVSKQDSELGSTAPSGFTETARSIG